MHKAYLAVTAAAALVAAAGVRSGQAQTPAATPAAKPAAAAGTLAPPTYTTAQATRGQAIYTANCAECHGQHLDDGEFAAALKGPQFVQHWGAGGLDGPWTIM